MRVRVTQGEGGFSFAFLTRLASILYKKNTSHSSVMQWRRRERFLRSLNGYAKSIELGGVEGDTYCHGSRGYQAFTAGGKGRAAGRSVDAGVYTTCVVACSANIFESKHLFFRCGEMSKAPGEKFMQ